MKTYTLYLSLLVSMLYGCKLLQKNRKDNDEPSVNSTIDIKKTKIFGDKAIITGRLLEMVTKEPQVGATVFLIDSKGSLFGCTSNLNGEFEIKNIPTGKYQLEVKHMDLNQLNTPLEIIAGKNMN